jgi:hypothetical protein
VGRSAIVQLPHIEGTWVSESRRSSTLAYSLLQKVEQIFKDGGKSHAWAFIKADEPHLQAYMERMGYKRQPVVVYSKELICHLA